MATIPSDGARERIRKLSTMYVEKGGNHRLQSSTWDTANWSEVVRPEWGLPQNISRNDVFSLVSEASTIDHAEKAFVAVMLWGFGLTGYGPHRVKEMRKSRPEGLGRYMLDIVEAATRGPAEAYRHMANNRATKLGPSYASKVAYFVTQDEGSPILDSLVARWIYNHHDRKWVFNPNRWSTPQYLDFQSYCQELLDKVSSEVAEEQRTLGLVEYLMFIDQAATALPKWVRTI